MATEWLLHTHLTICQGIRQNWCAYGLGCSCHIEEFPLHGPCMCAISTDTTPFRAFFIYICLLIFISK